jgi:hypothetical protein
LSPMVKAVVVLEDMLGGDDSVGCIGIYQEGLVLVHGTI